MKRLTVLRRSWQIFRVAMRYRLDRLLPKAFTPLWLKLLFLPARLIPARLGNGDSLRAAMQDLGPIFIKFGQMLSTRPDLLPTDIATALCALQDEVPPFPGSQAKAIVEEALGSDITQSFSHFEETPLASASIAQVHVARLANSEVSADVVVKVVRPNIEALIDVDVQLMFTLARLITRHLPDGRRLRAVEVVADYEVVIKDELNMQLEAANTSQLKRNFSGSEMLYVPEVYWDYVRRNVLVMERIHGIPVGDVDALRAHNTNLKVLAERGVEIFFSQVFRDSFFHADMHPGNIFVDVSNPDSPAYIAIDCAIIGTLDDHDLYYLARNLLAIFERDYRTVAEMHVESGWVPDHVRASDFESAIRSVCEPIFEKPLSEISFGQILLYMFTVARRFDMTVQPNLVLLQKTLLAVEGLGRQLYPQLDLWQTAQPFLRNWMAQRYAPSQVLQRLQKQAPSVLQHLPELPELLMDNLKSAASLREVAEQQQAELHALRLQNQKRSRQQKIAACALLAIAATLALVPDAGLLAQFSHTPVAVLGGLGLALYYLA